MSLIEGIFVAINNECAVSGGYLAFVLVREGKKMWWVLRRYEFSDNSCNQLL